MKKIALTVIAGAFSIATVFSQTVSQTKFSIAKSSKEHGFFGYGRNDDITLESTNTTHFLRIGSGGSIAFWAGMSAASNDIPHVEIQKNNTIFRNDIIFRSGNAIDLLNFKSGRSGDALISTDNTKILRFDGGAFGFWTGGSSQQNDSPLLKIASAKVTATVPFELSQNNVTAEFKIRPDRKVSWIGTTSGHSLEIGASGVTAGTISSDGNLFWGFDDQDVASMIRQALRGQYSIFVKKGILSADYSIAPVSTWADFVFAKDYNLKSLSEVERFIEANNHLPEVPSSEDIAKDGYSQHDMNRILLQKIEELTLYTIQQQKEIEALKLQLEEIKR